MPLGAAPEQKTGPYEEREVGNLSQRKGKKTIRPKGWERARIRVTDLQQSRDDPDGNDDCVKHDGSSFPASCANGDCPSSQGRTATRKAPSSRSSVRHGRKPGKHSAA